MPTKTGKEANPKLKEMPKKIHYVWMGKDIDPTVLRSILANKMQNPDYETIIWTDRERFITNTLNKFDDKANQSSLKIKSLDSLFEDLKGSPLAAAKLSDYHINVTEDQGEKLKSNVNIAVVLDSIFTREKNGVYRNYAAASDVARLAIMYLHGGMYLDVDVVMKVPIDKLNTSLNWRNTLSNIGLGMIDGPHGAGNGVLVGIPQAQKIFDQLTNIARLYNTNDPLLLSKPIDRFFIQVGPNNEVLNHLPAGNAIFCSENVSWVAKRANYTKNSNSFSNRFGGTMNLTGPGIFSENINFLIFYDKMGHFKSGFESLKSLDKAKEKLKNQFKNKTGKSEPEIKLYLGYDGHIDASGNWAANKPTLQNGARAEEAPLITLKTSELVNEIIRDEAYKEIPEQFVQKHYAEDPIFKKIQEAYHLNKSITTDAIYAGVVQMLITRSKNYLDMRLITHCLK